MTEREKMIDLIINAKKTDPETGSFAEYLADFLLGYGVKLPTSNPQPCKPLTLEQLREMDGKPVWVEFIGHPDGTPIEPLWMLVNCREKILVTDVEYVDWDFEGWFAYPYPPAHIDRSEWKPCEHCKSAEYPPQKFGAHQFPVVGNEIYFYDTEYGWECEEIKHCPWCGRPLTEEAWAELERRVRG